MNVLPPELHNEIYKFIKNKHGTNVMYSLAFYCYVSKGKRLDISYVCTSLKLLKWYTNKFQLNSNIFKYVALNGNLKNMKWLKKHNCPWNECTFESAALNGRLKNMKWLKKHNCPWDERTFESSAKKGILKNMKWLKKHNCLLYADTCIEAVKRGILKNMKWLKKNNCPWYRSIFSTARICGIPKNINWINENYHQELYDNNLSGIGLLIACGNLEINLTPPPLATTYLKKDDKMAKTKHLRNNKSQKNYNFKNIKRPNKN
jgi:hypothetical protein